MNAALHGPAQRIDAVDGLRAVAMSMVIAQHCGLLPFGWTGVWLFFVISGYVITRGFLADEARPAGDPAPDRLTRWRAFMAQRALRIVPVYLLYLALNLPWLLALGGTDRLGDLPWLLSFTYNGHMVFGFWPGSSDWAPFGHLWTLSVEQQFYLLFPLLALWVAPRLQVGATLALIACGPLLRWAWVALLQAGGADDPGWLAFAVYASSVCHFDAFLIGSLIARLEPRLQAQPTHARTLWAVALAFAAGYALWAVALNHAAGARGIDLLRNVYSGILFGSHREVVAYIAIDLVAAAALVHALLRRRGSDLLAWAPLAWVGRVSYGGYLYHALLLWMAGQALGGAVKNLPLGPRLLAFAVVWLATVAVASASFRGFEQPIARRWRQRRPATPAVRRLGAALPARTLR